MAALKEYKCPCCGGAIAFDTTLQKMKCPYCDTEFDMETLQGYDEDLQTDSPSEMQWQTNAGGQWQDGETDAMRVYLCNSCGGEIVGDENTAAARCPYCGNPVVMTGNLSGALRPDMVIPFQLDKNAAIAAYQKHISGKRLLPDAFKAQNHIDEIKGVYVPFWLFDADADAGIRYRATKHRAWSDSRYNYLETRYYSVLRAGSLRFGAVPVDGSSRMPDDLMESIEPFDLSGAADFQTAYLAGFFADKYDVDAEQSIVRANERIRVSTEQCFAETVNGFDSVTPEASSIRLQNGRSRYALYPVWLLSSTWNGEKFTFAMNGQTGKMVGDLPLDKAKSLRWTALIAAAGIAAAMAVQYLLWLL